MTLQLLAFPKSGAKPDVAVHVRPGVVQVQSEQAGVGAIVPVAAADREPYQHLTPARFYPATHHATELIELFTPHIVLMKGQVLELHCHADL